MANCPICGLRCVLKINHDAMECPDHGIISGITARQARGMDRVDALIEVMAAQEHAIVRLHADYHREELRRKYG